MQRWSVWLAVSHMSRLVSLLIHRSQKTVILVAINCQSRLSPSTEPNNVFNLCLEIHQVWDVSAADIQCQDCRFYCCSFQFWINQQHRTMHSDNPVSTQRQSASISIRAPYSFNLEGSSCANYRHTELSRMFQPHLQSLVKSGRNICQCTISSNIPVLPWVGHKSWQSQAQHKS